MTSRIAVLAIDSTDPRPLAEFWCAVLGWQVVEDDDDGVQVAPPDGRGPAIDLLAVPEGKTVKNRLHLDLRAEDRSTADELERLVGLGARRVDVGQSADVTWTVLADPQGNEFCLLSRSVAEVETGSD